MDCVAEPLLAVTRRVRSPVCFCRKFRGTCHSVQQVHIGITRPLICPFGYILESRVISITFPIFI